MKLKKEIVRVAAVQYMPDLHSREGTLGRVLQAVDTAAQQAPECYRGGGDGT